MFCPNCGKEPGGDKFCAHCGFDLSGKTTGIESKFKLAIFWPFKIISGARLEQRAWFRFLKVVHILLYVGVVLVVIVFGYFTYNQTTVTRSTLICKDGTTWDALNNDLSWSSAAQCGICTKRDISKGFNIDNGHQECSYSDPAINNSYRLDEQTKRTSTPLSYIIYPVIGLILTLTILRMILGGVIYIFAGKHGRTPPSAT